MKRKIFLLAALALTPAYAVTRVEPQQITLYCKGETFALYGTADRSESEALVRIGSNETYLEINGVGSGTTQGRPKLVTSMQTISVLPLITFGTQSRQVEVQMAIHIYSREISVFTVGNGPGQNGRIYFKGQCNEAAPLFFP